MGGPGTTGFPAGDGPGLACCIFYSYICVHCVQAVAVNCAHRNVLLRALPENCCSMYLVYCDIGASSVLFNLFVVVEPLIYFRVCHGTPINKNLGNTDYL